MMHATRSIVRLERLESRTLFAGFSPTAAEQFAVELINRARANPAAEAQLYVGFQDSSGNVYDGDLNEGPPLTTISSDAKQPLAVNPLLTDAARQHSAWMVANSTFSHTGVNGSNAGQRINAAGYTTGNWGENLAIDWNSNPIDANLKAADQHRNLFTDQVIPDRGHRVNMMEATRNEIGVGFATGLYNYPGVGPLNALAATHDTASVGQTYLTGVAITDAVADDDFYTPGEGLGGITVTATRQADGQTFTTSTWASGGYTLTLPSGTYDVAGTGTGIGTIAYGDVVIDGQNVKKDFITGQEGTTSAVSEGSVRVRGRTLAVLGTTGADVIGVYVESGEYLVGLNSAVTRWAVDLIDSVGVLAGEGNDRIVIGAGVARSYVQGDAGKDTLIGGGGADTLYGNAGIDRLEGNGGSDLLVGENHNDLIYGGLGNDRIYGGFGNDTIDAGGGNDRVYGGVGDDILAGGKGRDTLIGERGFDTLHGGAHTDYADDDADDTRIAVEVLL